MYPGYILNIALTGLADVLEIKKRKKTFRQESGINTGIYFSHSMICLEMPPMNREIACVWFM